MAADTVTTQTLMDGATEVVMKFTNVSGGDGESAVKKVDVSELRDAPAGVKIMGLFYSLVGMSVTMLWDADTDVRIWEAQGEGYHCFERFGGLWNNAGAGKTGDILFTTVGPTSGDTYDIILEMKKIHT